MSKKKTRREALIYHAKPRPGKIEIVPTKPYTTQRDLALAYSPGVAEPCLEIAKNKEDVYRYTNKGNLVAIISNGTAVLGLGNIGPEASKPVMEGKGLLFKIFADIDGMDIEVDTEDVDKFIETVKMIAPTFGGINLEDIKAPEAFEIERRLKEELDIPVMHDDQHGTAIISAAALLNALESEDFVLEEDLFGIGQSAFRLATAVRSLERRAEQETVQFADQGLMKWALGNVVVGQRGNSPTIEKDRALDKIDPVAALLDAATVAVTQRSKTLGDISHWISSG